MAELLIASRDDFERVLALARERARHLTGIAPDWALAGGIVRQLDFIAEHLARRTAPAQADADRVVLGVQAVRNFDDSDPDFGRWLSEIDYAFQRWARTPSLFT